MLISRKVSGPSEGLDGMSYASTSWQALLYSDEVVIAMLSAVSGLVEIRMALSHTVYILFAIESLEAFRIVSDTLCERQACHLL